jgi:hypothetical protein
MIVRDQWSSLLCGFVNGVGKKFCISGLYFKHTTIVNDDSSIINKLEDLLNDNARGIIYDRRMFIIQASAVTENVIILVDSLLQVSTSPPKWGEGGMSKCGYRGKSTWK